MSIRKRFQENKCKGYESYEVSVPGVEIYVNWDNLYLVIFEGRRQKPTLNYVYDTKEKMILRIEKFVKRVFEKNQEKEEQKAKDALMAKENRAKVNVGDTFHTSWGWEQTNIEFFQVVRRISPSRVAIRRISEIVVSEGYMSAEIKPKKDSFISEEKVVTINKHGYLSKADNYGHDAYKNDDNRTYCKTWYA